MKTTYVYRLLVVYPEGVNWLHPPDAWEPDEIHGPEGPVKTEFQWPWTHKYLSASSANARATLLRRYGCTVTVERSAPVVWPGEEDD